VGERNAPLAARALTWALGAKGSGPGKPQNGPHRPSGCHDQSCPRPACRAYKDGREDGYSEGFWDGVAACPREHK
jgi:hypothetical protein